MFDKKFENVKVGDTVMIKEWAGIGYQGRFRKTYFGIDFYIAHKVTKVLKTQFICGDLRFIKCGTGFGDNDKIAYKPNETTNNYLGLKKIPNACQASEMNKYIKKIKPLKKYSTFIGKDEVSPLKAKTVDDALEADKLMTKAKWIIEGKQ